jgi:cysteine-rich repeat protein
MRSHLLTLIAIAGCTSVVEFAPARESEPQCNDGLDNDGNGATDCADAQCAGTAGCLGCGNGALDAGEACDDGNLVPNDGCSPGCTVEVAATCGDGELDVGEECDDGNAADDDACLATCRAARCGDGEVRSGIEQCDDGNGVSGDGCDATCHAEQATGCGDGTVAAGEACDDNNNVSGDGCSAACETESCGDGIVQSAAEQCDDGNADDGDGCVAGCKLAACGDGFLRAGVEQCDDGNALTDDGCTATCVVERCGDGIAQSGPVVTAIEVAWLATSCATAHPITFAINGETVATLEGDAGSCTCSPGARTATIVAPAALARVVDGPNAFFVDFSGADHFLGWALVTVRAGAASTAVVVFEGVPGSALAQVPALCGGGFDHDLPPQTATHAVSVHESCDDGNTADGDGCDHTCASES